MPSDGRNKQFERALARHLRDGELDAACPDPETLAAYHERTMSLEEMSRWKEHIAGCARCQEALALVEQSEGALAEEWQGEKNLLGLSAARNAALAVASPAQATHGEETASLGAVAKAKTTEIRRPRKASRWAVPIGAIAAALLVWIGWHELEQTPKKTSTISAPVQVAQDREPQFQERDLPLQERSRGVPGEEKADTAKPRQELKAPTKDAKTPQRPTAVGGVAGGALGAIGNGSGPEAAPSIQSRGVTNSPARRRQDGKSQDADRAFTQMTPPAPAAPPPAASAVAGARTTAPSAATEKRSESASVKAATGGPLVNSQANQQANQQAKQQNEQTAQNANATLKKEEVEKQKSQTQTVEVSSLATGAVTTLNKLPMSLHDMANITPSVIVAPDNKNAWRVGQGGKIEHSGNAGNSWKAQPSGVKQDLIAGMAPSKKICWVVGKNGTLLLTTDGGKHWARILSPIRGDLGGVHAQDEQHASIWDVANHEAYETGDGGATWKSTANE
jgi:hypothetical protein